MKDEVAIQIHQRPEENPFLHTGRGLICVIAPDDKVFGKRLDKNSRKGDVELEILAPFESACFVRWSCGPRYTLNQVLPEDSFIKDVLPDFTPDLTARQRNKIRELLDQKEQINSLLNTLMLPPGCLGIPPTFFRRWTGNRDNPTIILPDGFYQKTNVVPMIYEQNGKRTVAEPSSLHTIEVAYDEEKCSFRITYVQKTYHTTGIIPPPLLPDEQSLEQFIGWLHNARAIWTDDTSHMDFPHKKIYGARAENGTFWVNPAFPKKRIHILYGEHDLFEYLDIDEAALVLEEDWEAPNIHKSYWTLFVVQNRHLRKELPRILSNNKIRAKGLVHRLD